MMGLPRRKPKPTPRPSERDYRLDAAASYAAQLDTAGSRCDRGEADGRPCRWGVRTLGEEPGGLPVLAIRCGSHADGRFTGVRPGDVEQPSDGLPADDGERAYRYRAATMYATQLATTGSLCHRATDGSAGCGWDVIEVGTEDDGAPILAIRCTVHEGGRYAGRRADEGD